MTAHRPLTPDPAGHDPLGEDAEPAADAAADPIADLSAALAGARYDPSRRHRGWTPEKQRAFCEWVQMGYTVKDACSFVQLSVQSAYAFRASAAGAVFALAWRAAVLIQRDKLADDMMARAFEGQYVTIRRKNGDLVERHYHDNRLAMQMLARADRMAEAQAGDGPADAHAARLVAQDWDAFLNLMEKDAGPARAALFLARRTAPEDEAAIALEPIAALARADLYARAGASDPAEVETADLDLARRAAWTAEQWARAEAAGLLVLAPPPAGEKHAEATQPIQHSPSGSADWRDEPRCPVEWNDFYKEWRTTLPPPPDFDGDAEGDPDDISYHRALTEEERSVVEPLMELLEAQDQAEEQAERIDWFAARRAELDAALARQADAAVAAADAVTEDDRAAAGQTGPDGPAQGAGDAG